MGAVQWLKQIRGYRLGCPLAQNMNFMEHDGTMRTCQTYFFFFDSSTYLFASYHTCPIKLTVPVFVLPVVRCICGRGTWPDNCGDLQKWTNLLSNVQHFKPNSECNLELEWLEHRWFQLRNDCHARVLVSWWHLVRDNNKGWIFLTFSTGRKRRTIFLCFPPPPPFYGNAW